MGKWVEGGLQMPEPIQAKFGNGKNGPFTQHQGLKPLGSKWFNQSPFSPA